jgi:hypothetical protein
MESDETLYNVWEPLAYSRGNIPRAVHTVPLLIATVVY